MQKKIATLLLVTIVRNFADDRKVNKNNKQKTLKKIEKDLEPMAYFCRQVFSTALNITCYVSNYKY